MLEFLLFLHKTSLVWTAVAVLGLAPVLVLYIFHVPRTNFLRLKTVLSLMFIYFVVWHSALLYVPLGIVVLLVAPVLLFHILVKMSWTKAIGATLLYILIGVVFAAVTNYLPLFILFAIGM